MRRTMNFEKRPKLFLVVFCWHHFFDCKFKDSPDPLVSRTPISNRDFVLPSISELMANHGVGIIHSDKGSVLEARSGLPLLPEGHKTTIRMLGLM